MKKLFLVSLTLFYTLGLPFPSFAMEEYREEHRTSKISIRDLSPIDVIEALWNNAIGCPEEPSAQRCYIMTKDALFSRDEVQSLLSRNQKYFEYLTGRTLKINFYENDELYIYAYDNNHGVGRAEKVINRLRRTNAKSLITLSPQEIKEKRTQTSNDSWDRVENAQQRLKEALEASTSTEESARAFAKYEEERDNDLAIVATELLTVDPSDKLGGAFQKICMSEKRKPSTKTSSKSSAGPSEDGLDDFWKRAFKASYPK